MNQLIPYNDLSLSPTLTPLTPLTTNQEELINKFNAAFYDAQTLNNNESLSLSPTGINGINNYDHYDNLTPEFTQQPQEEIDENEKYLLENLDESFFTNMQDTDNILLPLILPEPPQPQPQPLNPKELCESEDDNLKNYNYYQYGLNIYDEGYSDCYSEGFSEVFSDGLASELVTPSSDCTSTFDYDEFSENFEQFNHITSITSKHNEDSYYFNQEFNGTGLLPPVNTFKQCNWEFNQFLRHQDNSSLNYHQVLPTGMNSFGHLDLGLNDVDADEGSFLTEQQIDQKQQLLELEVEGCNEENLLVLHQNDALVVNDYDGDGFKGCGRLRTYSSDSDFDEAGPHSLQCKWVNCYQVYESQSSLVRHIEKAHVEVKRGDEFTCFWFDCPRKTKPFNARYKLLIHMRVHSGEKPNKCPFNGCNKAFSRLENLKIHQRSHTGERPYLCQFPTCTKSFSNSSDRAKHQRTHFDTKPYACQIKNCNKKYTDPSSLRKHVKNHTPEEQLQLKSKNSLVTQSQNQLIDDYSPSTLSSSRLSSNSSHDTQFSQNPKNSFSSKIISVTTQSVLIKQEIKVEESCYNSNKQLANKNKYSSSTNSGNSCNSKNFYANYEHDYTITRMRSSFDVKQDLKNKLSEKMHRNTMK